MGCTSDPSINTAEFNLNEVHGYMWFSMSNIWSCDATPVTSCLKLDNGGRGSGMRIKNRAQP